MPSLRPLSLLLLVACSPASSRAIDPELLEEPPPEPATIPEPSASAAAPSASVAAPSASVAAPTPAPSPAAPSAEQPPVRVKLDADAVEAASKCVKERKLRGVWKSELLVDKPQVLKVDDDWSVFFSEKTPKGKPQGITILVTPAGGCHIQPMD